MKHDNDVVGGPTAPDNLGDGWFLEFFERTSDAIFVMRGASCEHCNRGAATMFGLAQGDLVGSSPFDLSPVLQPDGHGSPRKARALLARATGGVPQQFEWQYRRQDGVKLDTEVSLQRVGGGSEHRLLLVARDVSARNRVAAEHRRAKRILALLSVCNQVVLRAKEEGALWLALCRALVQVGEYRMCWAGMVEHDEAKTVRPVAQGGFEDGYLESVDITWRDVARGRGPTGMAVRSGAPQVCRDILGDPAFLPWRAEASKRGYASSMALPLRLDGEVLAVLNIYAEAPEAFDDEEVRLLTVAADNLALGIGALRARVARTRALAELQKSEERLRTVFNNTPDYVLVLDEEHRIEMANRADEGVDVAQILGLAVYDFAPPEGRAAFRRQMDLILEAGQPQRWQAAWTHADGTTRHYSLSGTPIIVSGETNGSVLSCRDISDQLKLQKEKAELEDRFRHAQKMDAIGRLAGGVAHDFNNVLCAITCNADLALEMLSEGDELHEPMVEIADAAERAAELTGQLLAFSRKQIISPQVVDLSQFVEGLHKMLVRLIGEQVILRTAAQKPLGGVLVDPGQLQQVVLNLAINARDAMPEGGELLIETGEVTLDVAYCRKHPRIEPGAYVMLAVSDTGCGMSAEVRDQIFEPFYTTKTHGKGTGLGLATVFGIVEQNKGRIEVYSEPDHGSCFKVYFPRVSWQAGARSAGQAAPAEGKLEGGHECVLVVEDEEMVRRMAVRLLERLGYRVLAAASGAEALELAEGHEGCIELLLTDVVMPHMNGRQLAVRLRESRPQIKVLYTSGYTQNVIAKHGVLDEGIEFMPKPYSLDTIAARVREVIDS